MAEDLHIVRPTLEDFFGDVYIHEFIEDELCNIVVVGVVENSPDMFTDSHRFLFSVQDSTILLLDPEKDTFDYNLKYSTCHRCRKKHHCNSIPSLEFSLLHTLIGDSESEDSLCSDCYDELMDKSQQAFDDIKSSDSVANLI